MLFQMRLNIFRINEVISIHSWFIKTRAWVTHKNIDDYNKRGELTYNE